MLSLSLVGSGSTSAVRVSAAGTGRLTQIRASRRALAVPLPQSRKAIGRQMDGGDGGCLGVFGQTHAARGDAPLAAPSARHGLISQYFVELRPSTAEF